MMCVLLISAVLEVQRTKATFGEVQVCVVLHLAVFFFLREKSEAGIVQQLSGVFLLSLPFANVCPCQFCGLIALILSSALTGT